MRCFEKRVCCCSAGYALGGSVARTAIADVRHQFEVNVFAVLAVTQAFLPLLQSAGGEIRG